MAQTCNRAWLGMAALALASSTSLSARPSASAQAPPPGRETAAAEAPKAVTGADFAMEANAVEQRLARIRSEISVIDIAAAVSKTLDEIEATSEKLQADFTALQARRVMTSELNAIHIQLELLDDRVKTQIGKLSVYASDLQKLATQNDEDIEVWTRALRSARGLSIPQPVRDRATSILRGAREARDELNAKLGELLELQSRALDVRGRVQLAEQAVTVARREQAKSLLERQHPPLWTQDVGPEDEAQREGYDIRFSWPGLTQYLKTQGGFLLLHLLLFIALGWAFTRTRATVAARIEKRQPDGNVSWEEQAAEALRHPGAAALMLTIVSTRVTAPDRMVDAILLTWVVALPTWFVVVRGMLPAVFRGALLAMGSLAALHIMVAMVSGHSGVERALLLIELASACAGAGWGIRFLRNADVPKRVRQGLWFSLANLWTRLALVVSAIGVGATVLGYTHLASETATVAIIGTFSATAAMAVARILEAILLNSVYAGHLDAFRMVRANRDVTAKEIGRVIRLGASVLFLWSVTDMTSAWRPIAEALGRPLSADLGLGFAQTGITFGDLLAFFIILWASWLLARFVSFVLGEEVLPRLHMKTGVPYALTTFTRYTIIAVGFMAAMSVLGIPLDRLTIVISALGVGIGFGLQGLVNNFVSGFVLLTERPIRLRDKVEVGGVLGHVSSIGIRASTIRTFDGAEVIVPNGDLISQQVVNWTLSARRQRITIPVGVAYGTDPNQVLELLRKVAAEADKVFQDPAPLATFRGFGESSLDFELRIFMDPSDVLEVPSAVTVAINGALVEAGIEIPFPQRDLHLRGVPDGLTVAGTSTDADTDG